MLVVAARLGILSPRIEAYNDISALTGQVTIVFSK